MRRSLLLGAAGACLALAAGAQTVSGGAPVSPRAISPGTTYAWIGDSTAVVGTLNQPAGTQYLINSFYAVGSNAQGPPAYLQAFAGGALVLDYTAYGYPGSQGALTRLHVLTAGTCPANSTITATPSAPSGTPANTAGGISFTTDANGHAAVGAFVTPGTPGSGYTGQPTYTMSPSCSVQPTFSYVLTGGGTWGVPGDTTAGWLDRIAVDLCPNPPDMAENRIGTNDLTAGVAVATIEANIAAGVALEQACGAQPVLVGITPRTIGVSGWTATMDKARIRINNYERNLAIRSRAATPTTRPVLYVDVDHYWTDPSQSGGTIGNPLAGMTADGVHPSPQGAFYEALAVLAVIKPYLAAPLTFQPNSQSDVYDATNNPAGNLLGVDALMLGTGGTVNTPCTGTAPTHWTVTTNGAGTFTCAVSIENPRSDGLAGNRLQVVSSEVTGGATDRLTIDNVTSYAGNIAAGDKIVYAIPIDVSNMANVESIACLFFDNGATVQDALVGFGGTFGSSYIFPSSAQLATLQEAKGLPDFGLTAAGSYRHTCYSQPVTAQAGATTYTAEVRLYGNASGGATATITAKIGNPRVYKVVN